MTSRCTGARLPGFENELHHLLCGLVLVMKFYFPSLYHVANDGAYHSSLPRCWATYTVSTGKCSDREVLGEGHP